MNTALATAVPDHPAQVKLPLWRRGGRRLKKTGRRLWRRALGTSRLPSAQPQHQWAIGIYSGSSPVCFRPAGRAVNPVITGREATDIRGSFAADPFLARNGGQWHLFFEIWNVTSEKGEVAVATSSDGLDWQYRQVVLAEQFHLSYPYVFEWQGTFFMVPESRRAGEVRLYRAQSFPLNWVLETVLLQGPDFADSSVFRYGDRWWMFTENSASKHDTLRLFHSDELTGPWVEHPASPVLQGNPHWARPGGRVVVQDDRIIRYAQDCHPFYGLAVRAFEITELTSTTYREKLADSRPVLQASGRGWNRCGMHHLDAHCLGDGRWLACVDGWFDTNDTDWLDNE